MASDYKYNMAMVGKPNTHQDFTSVVRCNDAANLGQTPFQTLMRTMIPENIQVNKVLKTGKIECVGNLIIASKISWTPGSSKRMKRNVDSLSAMWKGTNEDIVNLETCESATQDFGVWGKNWFSQVFKLIDSEVTIAASSTSKVSVLETEIERLKRLLAENDIPSEAEGEVLA